jgi:hypothetical protein
MSLIPADSFRTGITIDTAGLSAVKRYLGVPTISKL